LRTQWSTISGKSVQAAQTGNASKQFLPLVWQQWHSSQDNHISSSPNLRMELPWRYVLRQWFPTGGPQASFLVGHGATAHFGMFKFTE